jgi:uncharacterized membrane protein
MSSPKRTPRTAGGGIDPSELLGVLTVLLGTFSVAFHLTSLLQSASLSRQVLSTGLWGALIQALGGRIDVSEQGIDVFLDMSPVLAGVGFCSLIGWTGGAWLIARRRRSSFRPTLCEWGVKGWRWWLIPLFWEAADILAAQWDAVELQTLLESTPSLWLSIIGAGWVTTGLRLAFPSAAPADDGTLRTDNFRIPASVWSAAAAYFVCFGAMNWLLYESLLVPHGDSAMYEEHLWNLLHGKGFRSYLDNGRLFLGEHVQVVHLLLIPLYVLWPSHILLELCQSLALVAGAFPVFWIARRHTGSARAAMLLSLAYLFYFPMQFLDVAIDFKTFRPNSFEIPFFLFALDALERRRFRGMLIWLALALSAQEDAAAIIAPLGIWLAATSWRQPNRRPERNLGLALACFGVLYAVVVVKVVLPWFRGGADVHFAQYFTKFGESSGEIATNLLTHPWIVLQDLLAPESLLFALALLVPLAFLPLLSPGRLAVAVPLFGMLCLSPITNSPRHHFHAPMIPIIVWAAAAGLGGVDTLRARWNGLNPFRTRGNEPDSRKKETRRIPAQSITRTDKSLPVTAPAASSPGAALPPQNHAHSDTNPVNALPFARWALACAVFTNFFFGLGPTSLSFWDPYSRGYWRTQYIPGERARRIGAVIDQIPPTSRVASTDFVHPRFTHYARSYDYSHYRPIVPDDTEYIVIDTQHPYSDIKRPDQVKELHDHHDQWELLTDQTGGYFIVLKRKAK